MYHPEDDQIRQALTEIQSNLRTLRNIKESLAQKTNPRMGLVLAIHSFLLECGDIHFKFNNRLVEQGVLNVAPGPTEQKPKWDGNWLDTDNAANSKPVTVEYCIDILERQLREKLQALIQDRRYSRALECLNLLSQIDAMYVDFTKTRTT